MYDSYDPAQPSKVTLVRGGVLASGGLGANTIDMNLTTLDRISRQLATIASIGGAKEIRDKAEAIRVYSRQQKACKHIEREATVIRLRAERS